MADEYADDKPLPAVNNPPAVKNVPDPAKPAEPEAQIKVDTSLMEPEPAKTIFAVEIQDAKAPEAEEVYLSPQTRAEIDLGRQNVERIKNESMPFIDAVANKESDNKV